LPNLTHEDPAINSLIFSCTLALDKLSFYVMVLWPTVSSFPQPFDWLLKSCDQIISLMQFDATSFSSWYFDTRNWI